MAPLLQRVGSYPVVDVVITLYLISPWSCWLLFSWNPMKFNLYLLSFSCIFIEKVDKCGFIVFKDVSQIIHCPHCSSQTTHKINDLLTLSKVLKLNHTQRNFKEEIISSSYIKKNLISELVWLIVCVTRLQFSGFLWQCHYTDTSFTSFSRVICSHPLGFLSPALLAKPPA